MNNQLSQNKVQRRSISSVILMLVLLIIVGTVGYMLIEGWNLLDALYMVIITLATVGFKEVHELSPSGVVFTMLLIIFGLVTVYYFARVAGEYILENKLREHLENQHMERTIKQLSGHYIICGFGRVGRQVAEELSTDKASFVIVEENPELAVACQNLGFPCIIGDATEETVLTQAGILSAKCLIICVGEDSNAVLTIVTAKSLNPNIFIVARANGENTAKKLLKIGANRVVSPHQIGGFRMANFALNPTVADFLDDVQDLSHQEVRIDDVVVSATSPVAGHSIAERLSNRTYGVSVLAIHKPSGDAIINPTGDSFIEAGDRLIVLGTKAKLDEVMPMVTGK